MQALTVHIISHDTTYSTTHARKTRQDTRRREGMGVTMVSPPFPESFRRFSPLFSMSPTSSHNVLSLKPFLPHSHTTVPAVCKLKVNHSGSVEKVEKKNSYTHSKLVVHTINLQAMYTYVAISAMTCQVALHRPP